MRSTLEPDNLNLFETGTSTITSVIAYGNPLRGDDGFGWQVAQQLIDARLENLDVITCHQLMPELAEVISQSRAVIFLDASLEVQAGVMLVRELEPKPSIESFTHHLDPSQLLALTFALYGRVPRAKLVSVGAINLEHNEHLSPEVASAIPNVLEEIQRWTTSSRSAGSGPKRAQTGGTHDIPVDH